MAKNSVTDYDTTAVNNTDVGGIEIEGDKVVANFDDALRQIMAHLKDEHVRVEALLTGQVSFFAGTSAPTGWLKCNGATVSRTTYADLFAVIGTAFGVGDGSTTFELPDMRGEFVRGLDDSRGIDSGRTLGTHQAEEVAHHAHYVKRQDGTTSINFADTGALSGFTVEAGTNNAGFSRLVAGTESSSSGNIGTGDENRPRNHALLSCIKY